MSANKKRSSRATAEQYKLMLDFFAANKGLAEGRFGALHGRLHAIAKWDELAAQLNSVSGAEKTALQWQVVWRDLKSRTSVKARERRKEMAKTGGHSLSITALTELEMRVLSIVGLQYVEGSKSCADSIPEEEQLQIALESGDDAVLLVCPTVPNTQNKEEGDGAIASDRETEVDMPQSQAKKRCLPKKMSKSKKRTVFDSARDQFALIAKQQAEEITMLAESAKQQAEAAIVQAVAFDRIAASLETLVIRSSPQFLEEC